MHRIQLLDRLTGPAYRDFANPGALSTTSVKLVERRAGVGAVDSRSAGTEGILD